MDNSTTPLPETPTPTPATSTQPNPLPHLPTKITDQELEQALQTAQSQDLIKDPQKAQKVNHNPPKVPSQPDRPIHQTYKGIITAIIFLIIAGASVILTINFIK